MRHSPGRVLIVPIILALTACTIDSGGAPQQAGEKPDNKITWFYPGGEQPESKKLWTDQVNRFKKAHPDIQVEVRAVPWDVAHDQLVKLHRAGDPPDVVQIGSRWLPEFSAMGLLSPLDPALAEAKRKVFYPAYLKTVTYQGRLYALPRQASTQALVYRKDLVKTPPKTWADLIKVAKQVERENPKMEGFGFAAATHVSTVSQFLTVLASYGHTAFDAQGKVALDDPKVHQALQLLHDIHREHKLMPNPLQYNREQFGDLFKAGQVAMFISGPWAGPRDIVKTCGSRSLGGL